MNIRTIAKLCGVSTTTVSRILNNKPDVKPETREKVIEMMNQLSFKPTVASTRHETIGVVTPTVSYPEFLGELMRGIMETAFPLGKTLTLIPSGLPDSEDITHFCRCNGLIGLMVINPPIDSGLPRALVEHEIPHVMIAATYRDSDISWVDVDNVGGCRDAAWHLLGRGHHRIALIHNPAANPCEKDRIQGYLLALEEHGIMPDPRLMYEIPAAGIDLTAPIRHMLQLPEPPTAMFCTTYRSTLSLLNTLTQLQIAVPGDVSMAGFGDYDVSPLTTPPMTTVHQPIYEMGRNAVLAFEEQIRANKYRKRQVMLPTRLIVRQSTRDLN